MAPGPAIPGVGVSSPPPSAPAGPRAHGRMASAEPSPPASPPASPEPELAQLRRKVEKLERELRSCKRHVREVEKLLRHTERLYQSAESNNQELRTQVRGPPPPRGPPVPPWPESLKSIKPRAVKPPLPQCLWSRLNSASRLVWTTVSGQARINSSTGYMVLISCPTGNGRVYLFFF